MVTRDCVRRGVFKSVPDLVAKIMTYIRFYDRNAQPFHWTYRNPRKRIRVSPISVTRHLVNRCRTENESTWAKFLQLAVKQP